MPTILHFAIEATVLVLLLLTVVASAFFIADVFRDQPTDVTGHPGPKAVNR